MTRLLEHAALLLLAAAGLALALAPWGVMQPGVELSREELEYVYAARATWNLPVLALLLIAAIVLAVRRWRGALSLFGRAMAILPVLFLILSAFIAQANFLEGAFPAPEEVRYEPARAVDFLEPDDEVIVVDAGGVSRAYAERLLTAHPLVHAEGGGLAYVVTYGPLEDLARVWKGEREGRPLRFTVAGMDGRELLLEDEATRSWWRQTSGDAILGPLAGAQLERLPSQVVRFGEWRESEPDGPTFAPAANTVLRPRGWLEELEGAKR